MKQLALAAAAMMFFVLAGIGWAAAVPMWTCSIRCLSGAAIVYVLMRLAGDVAVRMLAEAATRRTGAGHSGNNSADRT
ncbi:MAG: hypothetical protein ABFD92_04230 [Planctomycetaceae bacterium]|nr:hypothetical protein [Planctomycetaceae bacterium]